MALAMRPFKLRPSSVRRVIEWAFRTYRRFFPKVTAAELKAREKQRRKSLVRRLRGN